ncbi:MAG TPA: transcription termination/antitermination NusG family protein [Luteolibacter sp.]|nr:transcription termination/antitermination NusG family protein [Luteolibacter sp.]
MNPADPTQPAWYCARTQTKREHIAAEQLRGLEGVEVFCPRIRYRKATRRGKIWWMEPLFPGYLLVRFRRSEMERAVTFSKGIRGLVRFGQEIPTIPDSLVDSLRQEVHNRAAEGSPDETFTVSPIVEIGEEVEIASGPFQGMRGPVVTITSATERVKVLLEFLGQKHAIDVDFFSLLLPRKPIP